MNLSPPGLIAARDTASATSAGLTSIFMTGLLTVLGGWIGDQLGAISAGAMIGGLAGVVVGFAAVYMRFRDL